ELIDLADGGLKAHAAVDRFQNNAAVIKAFDAAAGHQRDSEVHGRRTLVKQKQRRYINGSSRKVNSSRGGRFDQHKLFPRFMKFLNMTVNGDAIYYRN